MRSLVVCVLLAAGLGACTPLEWQHPAFGTAHLQADLAQCDHIAMQEAWRYGWNQPPFSVPHVYTLPSGQRVVDPHPTYVGNPYANTGELRNFCMRSKGYELVPVPE